NTVSQDMAFPTRRHPYPWIRGLRDGIPGTSGTTSSIRSAGGRVPLGRAQAHAHVARAGAVEVEVELGEVPADDDVLARVPRTVGDLDAEEPVRVRLLRGVHVLVRLVAEDELHRAGERDGLRAGRSAFDRGFDGGA